MYPAECRVPEKSEETSEGLLKSTTREREETIGWGRLEISSRRLKIPREHFLKGWA